MITAAVELLLLAVLGVVYFNLRKQVSRQGEAAQRALPPVLRQMLGLDGQRVSSAPRQTADTRENQRTDPESTDPQEVAQLLEDLYDEWMGELRRVREDVALALARLHAELQAQIDHLAGQVTVERSTSASGPQVDATRMKPSPGDSGAGLPDVREGAAGPDAAAVSERYRAVIERLTEGMSPQQVAMEMGLSLTEVELVREVMQAAGAGQAST